MSNRTWGSDNHSTNSRNWDFKTSQQTSHYSGHYNQKYSNETKTKDQKIAELESYLRLVLGRNEELERERDELKTERDCLKKQVDELLAERNGLLLENVSLNEAVAMFAKEVGELKGVESPVKKFNTNRSEMIPEDPIVHNPRNSRFEENKYDPLQEQQLTYDMEIARTLQEEERREAKPIIRVIPQRTALYRYNQRPWETNGLANNINPDNMSYEELLALGEKIGHVSKGLDARKIEELPEGRYRTNNNRSLEERKCMVCQSEYEEGEYLKRLQCMHDFHSDCIKKWLSDHKTCPICWKDAL